MLSPLTMYVDSLRGREGATDSVLRALTFDHRLLAGYPHPRSVCHILYVHWHLPLQEKARSENLALRIDQG